MVNLIIIAILIFLVGVASIYIYQHKKKGKGCIGCPMSGSCSRCNCHSSSMD